MLRCIEGCWISRDEPIPEPNNEIEKLVEQENSPAMQILVPAEMPAQVHPLIRRSEPILQSAGKKGKELWREKACVEIHAEGPALERALRIADTLFKELEQRGYEITVTAPEKREIRNSYSYYPQYESIPSKTLVTIRGFAIEMAIEEGHDSIPPAPDHARTRRGHPETPRKYPAPSEYQQRPNGKLAFVVRNRTEGQNRHKWADGRAQRLEECMNAMVAGLIRIAEQLRLDKLEEERRKRERLEEERRRIEEARQREMEKARREDLHNRLENWRKSHSIRAFLEEIEAAARQRGEDLTSGSELTRWMSWARGYALGLEHRAMDLASMLYHR